MCDRVGETDLCTDSSLPCCSLTASPNEMPSSPHIDLNAERTLSRAALYAHTHTQMIKHSDGEWVITKEWVEKVIRNIWEFNWIAHLKWPWYVVSLLWRVHVKLHSNSVNLMLPFPSTKAPVRATAYFKEFTN